jgi:hypothetical protein
VAGRVFAFADPAIIKMLQNDFIPVSTDDWYTRRRKDDEGTFFRLISDQTRRKESKGTMTRQGIYAFTADGETLNMKNAGQDVTATKQQLVEALEKFKKLPENRRNPGAVEIPKHGPFDKDYSRTVPEGGLVLKVHGRILDKSGSSFSVGKSDFMGGERASRDFAWFTKDEAKKLVTPSFTVGHKSNMDEAIVRRICRFHFIDNTRGEPPLWTKKEFHKGVFTRTVSKVEDQLVTVKVDGEAEMASDKDYSKAERGFIVRLSGQYQVNRKTQEISGFQLTALGEHWGAGGHTEVGVRSGRSLLGITLDQVDASRPENRVSPQGVREIGLYYGRYDN